MRRRKRSAIHASAMTIVFGFVMVTVLIPTAVAAQTTLYMDAASCPGQGGGTETDPFCRIQDAIDAAMSGDEITVAPGTYNELIDLLGKGVTLRSSGGRDVTIIDAGPVPDPGTGKPVVRCDSGGERDDRGNIRCRLDEDHQRQRLDDHASRLAAAGSGRVHCRIAHLGSAVADVVRVRGVPCKTEVSRLRRRLGALSAAGAS